MDDQLKQSIAELDEATVFKLMQERFDSGESPQAILDSCRDGMTVVGQRYEAGEYYVSELIMAGDIFKQVMERLPLCTEAESGISRGKIVFGTVQGDIHNIGKDLVVGMLRAAGYNVIDLGVNVPAEKFVQTIRKSGARILGLSGLITTAFDAMKATVNALEKSGMRPKVKVMIGGGPVTDVVRKYAGADVFGMNAQDAVTFANQWIAEQETGDG